MVSSRVYAKKKRTVSFSSVLFMPVGLFFALEGGLQCFG